MADANIPFFSLNNGTKIPSVGMGCWMGGYGGGERVYDMCRKAISIGYRHFDTASGYGNEEQVGRAIRNSGLPRSEFYITTKLANPDHGRVKEAFETSLRSLNCEYIDLYLVHWPQASDPAVSQAWSDQALEPDEKPTVIDTWKEMEKLLDTGHVRSIGVSNFSIKILERLLPHCSVIPATNQVELHPCLPQHNLKSFCESKGIILTAYSPLGASTGPEQPISLFNNEVIKSLAEKLKVDIGQILVSWAVQRKTVVIPKTENETRMKNNITLSSLPEKDMEILDALHLQPEMHRTLAHAARVKDGRVFGWTFEDLGWNMNNEGVAASS